LFTTDDERREVLREFKPAVPEGPSVSTVSTTAGVGICRSSGAVWKAGTALRPARLELPGDDEMDGLPAAKERPVIASSSER